MNRRQIGKTNKTKYRKEMKKLKLLSVIFGLAFAITSNVTFAAGLYPPIEVTEDVFRQLVSDPEKMREFLRQHTEVITFHSYGDVVEQISVNREVEDNSFGGLEKQAKAMLLSQGIQAIPPYNVNIGFSFRKSDGQSLFSGSQNIKIQPDGKASLNIWYWPESTRFAIVGKVINGAYMRKGNQEVYFQNSVIVHPWMIGGNDILELHFEGDNGLVSIPMTSNINQMQTATVQSAFGNVIQHGRAKWVEYSSRLHDLNYIHEFTSLEGEPAPTFILPATVGINGIERRAVGIESVDVFDPWTEIFEDRDGNEAIPVPEYGTYRFRYIWPEEVYEFIKLINSNLDGYGKG